MLSTEDRAHAYIRAIRNKTKRAYADRYWRYLKGTYPWEPDRGTLSYMAAQAVQMQLSKIKRGDD